MMDENRLEELLFEIGDETVEAPRELVIKTKTYMYDKYHKLFIYLIPLSIILYTIFASTIVYLSLHYISTKYIYIMLNTAFTISNATIVIFLLLYSKFNESIN
ncbi:hypothetical protein KQI86_05940 [Clostridium sp. MSJ-11]|uniref:Uncharacterized protein n=1 Tax=Clostridium mobile TaxID=2841512 RepID=A0ABS6EF71_9CLOT|nr:hypothetical protein [Clostridium mobile]MBU5483863.1 hypothetical protein [Clostridium mobile]